MADNSKPLRTTITVSLTSDVANIVHENAKKLGQNRSFYIESMLKNALNSDKSSTKKERKGA
jgi:metal-responsive CopG/Arc/MetJ family transcriptional regulator